MTRFSEMVGDHVLAEVDVNPLIVGRAGAIAADALAALRHTRILDSVSVHCS